MYIVCWLVVYGWLVLMLIMLINVDKYVNNVEKYDVLCAFGYNLCICMWKTMWNYVNKLNFVAMVTLIPNCINTYSTISTM